MKFRSGNFELNYSTWGNSSGRPTLFFHGFPGSHVQAEAIAPLVKKHDLFLIACDRPGYGGSVGKGEAKEFLRSLRALLASLQIKKFDVLGVSGGAPWAHLMSSEFAEDISQLGVICGLCPLSAETKPYFSKFQRNGLLISRLLPTPITRKFLQLIMKRVNPENGLKHLTRFLNNSDRAILEDPANKHLITQSMQQARAQGAEGILFDLRLYSSDWLQECDLVRLAKIPTIYFHGQEDRILDFEMSTWMHRKNPRSKLKFFSSHGHYSLAIEAADQILSDLKMMRTT